MIRTEFAKLYIKRRGIFLVVIFIIAEIIFVNLLYPKLEFSSEVTERHFYKYMSDFSGQLTPEKEAAILAEQESIVDAQNAASAIEKRLFRGEYSSESQFISEYEINHAVTEKKEAFDLIFDQYSSALDAPSDRYLTAGNYDGLGVDIPDIPLLILVIFITAITFLNEETSGMITFIRISANGRKKTLCGKLFAISAFIIFGQIFRTALELFVMTSRGEFRELFYPLRTVEFFADSPYNISILQGFIAVSTLRLLGYFFIAALVILLSVTVKKAAVTVFIPSAACVLQQFAFGGDTSATAAYYLPTGLLRGVGYLRGDVIEVNNSGDEIKLFSKIPLEFLKILVILSAVFIAFSIITAFNYYGYRSGGKILKKISASAAVLLMCAAFSGCSQKRDTNINYNFFENGYFAQNDDYFYISSSSGITRISKTDGTELELIYNVWSDDINFFGGAPLLIDGEKLFYLNGSDLYAVSLDDLGSEKIYTLNYFDEAGFMGVKFAEPPDLGANLGIVAGFFSDGTDYYFNYGDRILKNGKRLFDDEIYYGKMCFDGRRIYYINRLLQLKIYDLVTGETVRLPGEFVRSLCLDGTRLLYSDKNGIFALDISDNITVGAPEKLSERTADNIAANGSSTVYENGGKLYLLEDDPDKPDIEIYDGNFETFAVSTDGEKLVVMRYGGGYEVIELLK